MPAFLIPIITRLIEWLAEKGYAVWQKDHEQAQRDKSIETKTTAEAEALKTAKDDEAFDEAAKNTLSRH